MATRLDAWLDLSVSARWDIWNRTNFLSKYWRLYPPGDWLQPKPRIRYRLTLQPHWTRTEYGYTCKMVYQ